LKKRKKKHSEKTTREAVRGEGGPRKKPKGNVRTGKGKKRRSALKKEGCSKRKKRAEIRRLHDTVILSGLGGGDV